MREGIMVVLVVVRVAMMMGLELMVRVMSENRQSPVVVDDLEMEMEVEVRA
jgi:hypothetical protein